MNLFTKAFLSKILNPKISSGEIKHYQIFGNKLKIIKSKRSKHIIDISSISDSALISLFNKKIPNADEMSLSGYFKIEIRNLKIRKTLDNRKIN